MKHYKLKGLRAERELTQRDIADVLGLKSLSNYHSKENGKRDFSMKEINKLIEFFNKPYEEIFFTGSVPNKGTNKEIS